MTYLICFKLFKEKDCVEGKKKLEKNLITDSLYTRRNKQ